MVESNEKVKTLCDTVSRLECKLSDVNNQLVLSNKKCDQLTKDNEKLRGIEDDLSKQVNDRSVLFLLKCILCLSLLLCLMFMNV